MGKVNGIVLVSSLIIQLMGCNDSIETQNEQNISFDAYPKIEIGVHTITGTLISSIFISEESEAPGLIRFENECYMSADVKRFGEFSASVSPFSLTCGKGYDFDILGKVSTVYLDGRISGSTEDIIDLQVYDRDLIAWLMLQ